MRSSRYVTRNRDRDVDQMLIYAAKKNYLRSILNTRVQQATEVRQTGYSRSIVSKDLPVSFIIFSSSVRNVNGGGSPEAEEDMAALCWRAALASYKNNQMQVHN